MTAIGTVSQIWRYPISSLGGERLSSAALDAEGIVGDRLWGVADARSHAVANPPERRWRSAPEVLARTGPDGPEIRVPEGTWCPALGPDAAAALTRHFGFPAEIRRHVPFETEGRHDAVAPRYRRANLHLLTTASLQALRDRLPPDSLVDSRRFRPNLVIATADGLEGFIEADWVGRDIAVGRAVIRITEPCERCAFTTLAQADLPFDRDILGAIARHGGGGFGALCTIIEAYDIAVGDAVRIL